MSQPGGVVIRAPRMFQSLRKAWTRSTSALLVLLALAPLVGAFAATAETSHCCTCPVDSLAPPPPPCHWIAAMSCCHESASLSGVAPQPAAPPAIALPVLDPGWKSSRHRIVRHAPQPLPRDRLALSTVVLQL